MARNQITEIGTGARLHVARGPSSRVLNAAVVPDSRRKLARVMGLRGIAPMTRIEALEAVPLPALHVSAAPQDAGRV